MIVLIKISREDGWPEYRQQVSELSPKPVKVPSFKVGRVETQVDNAVLWSRSRT
jgi:hypothetical protein